MVHDMVIDCDIRSVTWQSSIFTGVMVNNMAVDYSDALTREFDML